jgi:hypothetical protein
MKPALIIYDGDSEYTPNKLCVIAKWSQNEITVARCDNTVEAVIDALNALYDYNSVLRFKLVDAILLDSDCVDVMDRNNWVGRRHLSKFKKGGIRHRVEILDKISE